MKRFDFYQICLLFKARRKLLPFCRGVKGSKTQPVSLRLAVSSGTAVVGGTAFKGTCLCSEVAAHQ